MAAADDDRPPYLDDLIDELRELADDVGSSELQSRVEDTIETARDLEQSSVFGRVIRGFDRADVAEALVGSLIFGIPMIIEGGTLEVGEFIAGHPVYYAGTIFLGVVLVYGILYVADIQQVEVVRPILGVLPRRFAGVVSIAFASSFVLMTAWGRVDWTEPTVAFAQICVVFVGMAIGAALGDILPGS